MGKRSVSASVDEELYEIINEKYWKRVKEKTKEIDNCPKNPREVLSKSPIVEELLWKGLEDSIIEERLRKKIQEIADRRGQSYKEVLNEVIREGIDFLW